MGTDYWREMVGFIEKMAHVGTIRRQDLELIYVTDSAEDAIAHIREKAIKPFGLKPALIPHHSWLGECGICGCGPRHVLLCREQTWDRAGNRRHEAKGLILCF